MVLQNLTVGGCLLLRSVAHTTLYKHIIVEITLVYLPHIDKTKHYDGSNSILGLQLLLESKQQYHSTQDNDEERTPAIGGKDRYTYLTQIGDKRTKILAWYLLKRFHL